MNNEPTLLIKIAAAAILAVNAALIIPALATDDANDRAYIETVKANNHDALTIDNTYRVVDEQIDDERYEQSEQAANAKHANSFLAKAYKDKGDEQVN